MPHVAPELQYLAAVVLLFVVPRVLQRFRVPSAITCVGGGALAGMGFGLFHGDTAVPLLSTLGIVSLFLFAGLEVDLRELRRNLRVVAEHLAVQVALLAGAAYAAWRLLHLDPRAAVLFALAVVTPSTGFILDSLGGFGLSADHRFWVKTKAIATEIVALAALFGTVRSGSAAELGLSTAALLAMIAALPWAFRAFARHVLPHAPKSEFSFLVVVAATCAYATRALGVYYLVGAFVVGVTAVRMRDSLPTLASERVLDALELFAKFFIPFYFFKAGLHLQAADFSLRAVALGLGLVAAVVPLKVLVVSVHRRLSLREPVRDGARVGLSLVPTLVFTIVIADILRERYALPPQLYGALLVYTLANTTLPGLLLRAPPPEFDAPEAPPSHAPAPVDNAPAAVASPPPP